MWLAPGSGAEMVPRHYRGDFFSHDMDTVIGYGRELS